MPVPTIRQALDHWRAAFAAAGVDSPRLTIELLLAHVLGVERGVLAAMTDRELAPDRAEQLDALCARRARREPLAYLLGYWEFYGRRFAVRPGVLIPRPETEQIITLARRMLAPDTRGWAVDIGCGSGVLAVTLALEFPCLRVLALDLHEAPLRVTAENARLLGVAGRVCLARMDGLAALRPSPLFDLVVSNPPYVTPEDFPGLQPEVRDFEPREALVGGAAGLEVAARLPGQIASRARPGAPVLMEHGMEQGAALRRAAAEAGLGDIRTEKDFAGLERILVARA
ncbi:MAG: peptide chain release factor N(5)-glutamine methyltransferase [Planctomycetes bacterium]|nr:peptide chain release factor N(5)-glutamine methyltransferase [Planctomycetota bacterium]MCL4729192.1 peptide chain release factor N(5)-glutamine methyltransferase [Planctomycetota bacterium]